MKKGYLQISFGWLFAIVVGIFIIALAIFLVTKLINIEGKAQEAETGKEIGILLNPLETSFESAKTTSFSISSETRINNLCEEQGEFGNQIIQVSQKTFNKWKAPEIDTSFQNKYIFSEELEGKKFYVFSKPFEFPFKIADLVYMTSSSEKYCFEDAPEEIEEEILNLNQENLVLEPCSENSIKVCFNLYSDCDINVNSALGIVEKDGDEMYFEGNALMYAAIFSNLDIYECQLKRLMKRAEELALIYKNKENFILSQSCERELSEDLGNFISFCNSFTDISTISSLKDIVEDLEYKNDLAICKLW